MDVSEDIKVDGCLLKRLVVGPLEVNCYIICGEGSKEAAVIDPGGDGDAILEALEGAGLSVKAVINTHGHFDHVGADGEITSSTGALLAIHPLDVPLLEAAPLQAERFGLSLTGGGAGPWQVEPSILLADKEVLEVGTLKLTVLHTPGHSEGGVCLYLADQGIVFTGDTLFAGSIGRTDLPGGSMETLLKSIAEKLLTLPEDVVAFPGHGPETTIKDEAFSNPFIQGL